MPFGSLALPATEYAWHGGPPITKSTCFFPKLESMISNIDGNVSLDISLLIIGSITFSGAKDQKSFFVISPSKYL